MRSDRLILPAAQSLQTRDTPAALGEQYHTSPSIHRSGDAVSDIKRIERAVRSSAYLDYSRMIGVAIAQAAMAETAEERKAALDDALALQAEQAQLVREAS